MVILLKVKGHFSSVVQIKMKIKKRITKGIGETFISSSTVK